MQPADLEDSTLAKRKKRTLRGEKGGDEWEKEKENVKYELNTAQSQSGTPQDPMRSLSLSSAPRAALAKAHRLIESPAAI